MARVIAIVEDEEAIRENYAAAFRHHGYEVSTFGDRPSAMAAFQTQLPDLAIIDIGLGDEAEGGFELCRQLRARSTTLPIIFLTARDGDIDSISGLRLGADDFITKAVSLPHLMARIAALLRRVDALRRPPDTACALTRGELRLDTNRLTVHWKSLPVLLTVTEFWLVHALVRFPGHVKTREQLMAEASVVVDDNTITAHIKRIRRKFSEIDPEFSCIDTVYGAGYRWIGG